MPDFKVAGGASLLPKPKRKIIPQDVINLLNNILGDLHEIKQSAGIKAPTKILPLKKGKSPKDVFMKIKRASALMDTLL